MANSRDTHKPNAISESLPLPAGAETALTTHSTASAAVQAEGETLLHLDPFLVRIPTTPNRLDEAYEDEAFDVLRQAIQAGGRNVEPIEVS